MLDGSQCSKIGKTCVGANLRKASRLISRIYDDHLRPSGLKATQFGLLVTVQGFGRMTVSRLADRAVMDRTTVARNLKVLEKKKLVVVARGMDQRQRVVMVTEEGRQALISALPFWEKAQCHIDDVLGADKSEFLVKELSTAVYMLRKF
jgi:DNA-binding MarR family transcriptional regulator